jgi:tetratricopeptide (TPR) repeat protein
MKDQTCRWLAALTVLAVLVAAGPGFAQYREYYVFGKVLDTQKAPLEGVEVTIFEVATSLSFTEKTKKDGAFKFAGLPHGLYRVVFKKPGFAERKDEWDLKRPQDKMVKFEVPPVILATQEYAQESARMKESAAGVKEAAEKVRQGDFDAAIVKLQAILEKSPKDTTALYLLGLAHLKKKEWPAAQPAFLQVVELTPGFPAAHYYLGVCYQQLNEPEKALESYQKAAELDPSNPDNLFNAGLVLFGLNRIDEAQSFFAKTLALRPEDPAALEMAGRCCINQANFPKAVEYLEKAKAGYAADSEKAKFLDDLIAKLKEQIKKAAVPAARRGF